jgi:hypothetical protein
LAPRPSLLATLVQNMRQACRCLLRQSFPSADMCMIARQDASLKL